PQHPYGVYGTLGGVRYGAEAARSRSLGRQRRVESEPPSRPSCLVLTVASKAPSFPPAFPGAGASPAAAVCDGARAPAWSAVVVRYCCQSRQGVSPLRAPRSARRSLAFLR